MLKKSNRGSRFNDNKLRSIILFFLLIPLSGFLFAQNPEPTYRRYTVDDGLPSSMVYHVFQDSKGYIWFATANGVSRYDGYKFENFDIQSGLVDNDVFEIYEDYKHRIWFIPMSGSLCYYENGKVISYKYNNKIKDYIPVRRGPIKCSFYVDSLDYVYLSIKQIDRFSISPEGLLKKYEEVDKSINLLTEQMPNGVILTSNPDNANKKNIVFRGLFQNFTLKSKDVFGKNLANPHHLFFLSSSDSSVVCSLYEEIFKIKKGKIISRRNYHKDIIWMSIDNSNNLWVAPIGGGIYCYANCDFEGLPYRNLLKDCKITSVLKDREGAYWFSSLNDGVFYCSNINFLNYTKKEGLVDDRINAVDVNKDGVYIGYEFGYVDLLKKDGIKHFYSPNKQVDKPSVRKFLMDSLANRVWVSSIVNLNWIQNDIIHEIPIEPNDIIGFPKKVVRCKSGGYWVGSTKGLIKCENDKIVYTSFLGKEFTSMIYDLVEDCNGVVWCCTINGLWKYSNNRFKYLGADEPLFAQTTYSLMQNPIDSSLWLGTNGAGIVIKKHEKAFQITKEDGLISNSINQLYYSEKNIWVATKQGLSEIIIDGDEFKIKNFTTANGLPTNEVTAICDYKGVVYVGTPKGLTIFSESKIVERSIPPDVVISNFKVNNIEIDMLSKRLDLSHDQNSLNIDFVGFTYRNEGRVNYRYRMIGIDTTWVQTQTPNCLYNGLTSGDYVFEVEAQSYNGVWSLKPALIAFTIHPPFWKRLWFLVFGTIIFSSFIFLVYKVRITEINRRNNLLQNINLYKQQSLRQQMNPHFIFNTLNSIQLYILEKDSISSHKYLTKFARLMRMTLDNSLYSTIPLRDEIEALKLYLDLEKLRLEDKFNYFIDYGDNESILYYKIPTLLIQPFVENSIWHGISHRQDRMGSVKISLVDNNDSTITCVVEDNGVGRKLAGEVRQMRNKDHKSRGSQITQQRIDLLSMMYGEKFSVYYDDPIDSEGMSLGTKVSIVIPKEI